MFSQLGFEIDWYENEYLFITEAFLALFQMTAYTTT